MAPRAKRLRTDESLVFYALVNFRQGRRGFRLDDTDLQRLSSDQACSDRKLLMLVVQAITKSCLPGKIRRAESTNIGWRHHKKRRFNQNLTRPTLLLPPMQPSAESSALVVSTRVQGDLQYDGHSHLQSSPPEPSAPSPGHIFYNSEDHSDITFLVGQEQWRFPAHSFILEKMGPTLQELLIAADQTEATRVKEVAQQRQCSIGNAPVVLRLPHMQPDVFEQVLRFIYTGQISFSSVISALNLLPSSQRYHIPELTSRCLAYVSKHVSPSNVLQVLNHLLHPIVRNTNDSIFSSNALILIPSQNVRDSHDEDNRQNELVLKCFLMVDNHADDVLRGEFFETLEHEMMIEIIKRDTLHVSSEIVVFEAIMRWACRACKKQRKELTIENKREVLGKALYLVRYLLMSPNEFLRGPITEGVLDKEDKDALLSKITGNSSPSEFQLPDHLSGWKMCVKRQHSQNLAILSPGSECDSRATNISTSPSCSIMEPQTMVSSNQLEKKNEGERKKKSMSKKLLNGVGDLVICVIQLLD